MSVRNNIPNVNVTFLDRDCNINLGTQTNQQHNFILKSVGSASTIGENGINLGFGKNLFIRIRPES